MALWSKWEERFKSFGATRVQFVTSRKGGVKGSKDFTGAKCLMFFDCKDNEEEILLENISERTFLKIYVLNCPSKEMEN